MSAPVFLHDVGIVCALGHGKAEVWRRASTGDTSGIVGWSESGVPVGRTRGDGVALTQALVRHNSRNNRLLMQAVDEIRAPIEAARAKYGAERIAVVLGTSTSGIEDGLSAVRHHVAEGVVTPGYHYNQQEIGSPSVFLSQALGLKGPAYVVSTACTSSARAFASARRLLRLNLADAVIVGGVDSLAALTVNGFQALESLSRTRCNPMSLNRDGLAIGDGAAVFLLSREPAPIALHGIGSCSDAHHMSAPDPQGRGAIEAMQAALAEAGLVASAVDYVNLHGTATELNDAMEARAVAAVFGEASRQPWVSSTKPMTGHTLGAAGAIELAISWLALSSSNSEGLVPPHVWDGVADPKLPVLNLAPLGHRASLKTIMSNSFAFGGNNVSLLVGRST
jgi:3-oxoacyl-[acyl-carrier-protein] synthase-1